MRLVVKELCTLFCAEISKKPPSKQQSLISLSALGKEEPYSFSLETGDRTAAERGSNGCPKGHTTAQTHHTIWLTLCRKFHTQRYPYGLLYIAINPTQLLSITSQAQIRCKLYPCHSSGQHYCTAFFLKMEGKYLVCSHWLPDCCHGAFSLAEDDHRDHLVTTMHM